MFTFYGCSSILVTKMLRGYLSQARLQAPHQFNKIKENSMAKANTNYLTDF